MTLPDKDGTFTAKPLEWGVGTTQSGTAQFWCKFDLQHWWNGTEWVPAGNHQITGYFYPVKKDGSLNDRTIASLCDSLGWDGASFQSLSDGDWSAVECQLVLAFEEYNGQSKLKVRFINPIDYSPTGGGPAADPQAVKSLDAQFGSQLRAMAGSRPARPKAPAAPKAVPAAPAAGTSGTATLESMALLPGEAKQQAWATFKDRTPDYDDTKRAAVFKKVVGEVYPGRDPKGLKAEEWATVRGRIDEDFDPATEGLIPF